MNGQDVDQHPTLTTVPLPFYSDHEALSLLSRPIPDPLPFTSPPLSPKNTAYLHHTSGTSTGIPKPIPQSHHAAILVLPHLPPPANQTAKATFTTTPLYHGGIADLFRSWTSDAPIYLFPASHAPIIASNIVSCLDLIKSLHAAYPRRIPGIKYFSSVPYVLSLLSTSPQGLAHLQSMHIVGVGGAALLPETGDTLVSKNVNLISRFGSAEAGFILSSARQNYETDKAWSYLRLDPAVSARGLLQFEPQRRIGDNGPELYELVIGPAWPHLAKRNRDDGSYATADLFERHATLEDAWRYHSRADSQLTLVTGRKFDPEPLEAAIVAGSGGLLKDCLVFGNGREYPGALVFPSGKAKDLEEEEIMKTVRSAVENTNAESAKHAWIGKNMVVLVPSDGTQEVLEKSSKGTVLRGPVEKRYAKEINGAYEGSRGDTNNENIEDEKVIDRILGLVASLTCAGDGDGEGKLAPDTNLFAAGVDSVACIQIRRELIRLLPKSQQGSLPLTVVEDCGTPRRLADFVLDLRHGRKWTEDAKQDQRQLMEDMVRNYSMRMEQWSNGANTSYAPKHRHMTGREGDETVILTGATGFLGSHILNQLLTHDNPVSNGAVGEGSKADKVKKIVVLLRGTSIEAARARVRKELIQRKLIDIDDTLCPRPDLEIIPIKLNELSLGLSDATFARVANEGTTVIHAAWTVNFLWGLRSFEGQLDGLSELLRLAAVRGMSFLFASSVASVAHFGEVHRPTCEKAPQHTEICVPEEIVSDPAVAGPTGYAQSKWVAEQLCEAAAEQYGTLRGRIAVLRVGQLSGDTVHGIWNASEGWPLMISSVTLVDALPELDGKTELLEWLPVDLAAQSILEIMGSVNKPCCEQSGAEVFHVSNVRTKVSWEDLLEILRAKVDSYEVANGDWIERLEESREKGSTHPCLRLMGFWQGRYGKSRSERPRNERPRNARIELEQRKTAVAAPTLRKSIDLDQQYLSKVWTWVQDTVK